MKILDKEKNPVAIIDQEDREDFCIETELELNDKTLSFTAPYSVIRDCVVPEGYIETKDDIYVIKEVKRRSSGAEAQIVAKLNVEELEGKTFVSFASEEQTIRDCLNAAFVGTGWVVGVCGISKRRTIRKTHCTALEIISQCLSTYRCEILIDSKNKIINVYEEIGSDKGVYFTKDLNLDSLDAEQTSYDFYTEIEAYGKDGLTFADINDGKNFLTNYTYSTKKKRIIWKDERYTVASSLMEDAAAKLADYSVPLRSYSASVKDLSQLSGYWILDYDIGDTVTLLEADIDVREKQRIVAIKHYPDNPEKDSCTLANKYLTFEELSQKYRETSSTVENITSDNGTVDGSTVDEIKTSQISDFESAIINNATIQNLEAENVEITGTLTAVRADIGTLNATVGNFTEIYTMRLEAAEADIQTLRVTDLTAINASIDVLDAGYANITSLLAGNAGVGDLQNIHLTSANAVIDVGVIRTLLANNITVNDLMAGDIITNRQRIISNDGTFLIDGSTQYIYDSNGNIRIQLGQDANDNFTFSLFDETGTGVLIDATGIKEGAIANGLIKDAKIASDANIQASKLDIASLFTAMNADNVNTLYANKIWFDEQNQSLAQMYTQMSSSITMLESTATTAAETAQAASENAQVAVRALEGITSLDNLTATLSNDSHVVHTDYDGTGGIYTDAVTTLYAYKGDTDVSTHAAMSVLETSAGLTGTWDPNTRTYQVTGMTEDNGYVDFDIAYGITTGYLYMPDGSRLVMPNDKVLKLYSGTTHVYKRFSISKSPDGQAGVSYNLQASVGVIRRSQDATTLNPPSVTFTALRSIGEETTSYIGKYKIEESDDGGSWTQKYLSPSVETSKTYTPTTTTRFIRCTLLDENSVYLDSQTVTVIADADELADTVAQAQQAIQTTNTRVGRIETSVNGIQVDLANTQTELHGVSDGALLFQTPYTVSEDIATFTARVYKAGTDVHTSYPKCWFEWFRKTEDGTVKLGTGYTVNVNRTTMGYGGSIIGRFTTFEEGLLVTPDGNYIAFPNSKRLKMYYQAA